MKTAAGLILSLLLLCRGCDPPAPAAPRHLITSIRFSCPGELPSVLELREQEELKAVLTYLRSAEFLESGPVQPTQPVTSTLTLAHPDGRRTVYRQAGDSFLQRSGGCWHRIDPRQGQQLRQLFRRLQAEKASGAS